jgi:hypothetical protein
MRDWWRTGRELAGAVLPSAVWLLAVVLLVALARECVA